ncbi:hypothetical protein HPP92_020763 [Vanilla planifolia]|uniref:Uncharacterized protein n=1 Tax=Vanilla planifolia TaxID=51239 RepID=A0A835Q3F7_VANPL|nr:hypothetical protein HPP92_021129 [Vanilla planifolia]KAG0462287.1 hypothetical protein HPP92_020763 [Vanilla planifolia]
MEGLKLGLRSTPQESTPDNLSSNLNVLPPDQARIFIRTGSRHVVSLWTCSKLCAISFAVGIFVGFTLKRRLRQWAGKLLKKLKDD